MYVQRRRTRVDIWAPAKLNLFLEVLSRRADGFHEIETLMVPIDCFDTLRISLRDDKDIVLACRWAAGIREVSEEIPTGADNLVTRALTLLRRRVQESRGALPASGRGLSVELVKRIPSAAGLGGGSSDAAAALYGANLLWQLGWSRQQLAGVASELGSDIPFFLDGGAAFCRGRGELIEPVHWEAGQYFVVLRPPQGLATAAVYRSVEVPATPQQWCNEFARDWPSHLFNRLQQAARSQAPWLELIEREFSRLDLVAHQMSGSGSSYFGVCRNARHANWAAAILRHRCQGRVMVVRSLAYDLPYAIQASQN